MAGRECNEEDRTVAPSTLGYGQISAFWRGNGMERNFEMLLRRPWIGQGSPCLNKSSKCILILVTVSYRRQVLLGIRVYSQSILGVSGTEQEEFQMQTSQKLEITLGQDRRSQKQSNKSWTRITSSSSMNDLEILIYIAKGKMNISGAWTRTKSSPLKLGMCWPLTLHRVWALNCWDKFIRQRIIWIVSKQSARQAAEAKQRDPGTQGHGNQCVTHGKLESLSVRLGTTRSYRRVLETNTSLDHSSWEEIRGGFCLCKH